MRSEAPGVVSLALYKSAVEGGGGVKLWVRPWSDSTGDGARFTAG